MTLSPERTAEKIVHDIFLSGQQWGQHDWKLAEQIIATAIRQACNEKLEEAARYADKMDQGDGDIASSSAAAIARDIRSLKDQPPTPKEKA